MLIPMAFQPRGGGVREIAGAHSPGRVKGNTAGAEQRWLWRAAPEASEASLTGTPPNTSG